MTVKLSCSVTSEFTICVTGCVRSSFHVCHLWKLRDFSHSVTFFILSSSYFPSLYAECGLSIFYTFQNPCTVEIWKRSVAWKGIRIGICINYERFHCRDSFPKFKSSKEIPCQTEPSYVTLPFKSNKMQYNPALNLENFGK